MENMQERLGAMSREELMGCWQEQFICEPPAWMGHKVMQLAIAWQMQARARGMQWHRPGKSKAAPTAVVRPGTRFIREWHGDVHEVVAVPEGFMWQGQCYKSLSVIARTITGMRWSGPLFFGLREKKP